MEVHEEPGSSGLSSLSISEGFSLESVEMMTTMTGDPGMRYVRKLYLRAGTLINFWWFQKKFGCSPYMCNTV